MAEKFANRIDYVDLSAFGVGVEKSVEVSQIKEFDQQIQRYQGMGKLELKLKDLDTAINKVAKCLQELCVRYDLRMEQAF